jgi:hypothetical protein
MKLWINRYIELVRIVIIDFFKKRIIYYYLIWIIIIKNKFLFNLFFLINHWDHVKNKSFWTRMIRLGYRDHVLHLISFGILNQLNSFAWSGQNLDRLGLRTFYIIGIMQKCIFLNKDWSLRSEQGWTDRSHDMNLIT